MSNSPRHRVIATIAAAAIIGTTVAAVAATTPKSGKWKGTTSEKVTVSFSVSSNHKQVTNFVTQMGYNGKCGQGGGPGFGVHVGKMAISKKHTFAATTISKGFGRTITVKVAGSISGSKASGSVSNPASGCAAPYTGRLAYSETFTAKHA
ncbi:MAG TPA: hypothetical protein VFG00_01580 [Acidothermaceae bacterium]|nr:hypothetical protein [Acidothermaceae bacterium]